MTVSDASGLHSNAYNFLSYVNSGVDPRTGIYSCNFSLSNFMANALSGPSVPMLLGFQALQNRNLGFGRGWSLQLSSFDRATGKLNLSSGASYKAELSTNNLTLKDKKIKDVKTSRSGFDLLIEHKTGILEVLSNPSNSSDEWLVSKIYSAEGRVIHLKYDFVKGLRILREIRDETRRLLTVDRSGSSSRVSSITLWPDSPAQKLVFGLEQTSDQLSKINLLAGGKTLGSWRFKYATVTDLMLITQLDSPTGGTEKITYQPSGLLLPSAAPVRALPVVSSYCHDPRNSQPAITREYKFSTKNYLGYGSSVKWSQAEDNLYLASGDYQYSSTEDLMLGGAGSQNVVRRTQRVYNRFHLLLEETVTQNGKTVSTQTQYHDKTNIRFENQPANLQLPARVEVSYSDLSIRNRVRSEITLTEYDECGNVLKKVSPSGIVEIFEYYPVGVSDGCPADAFGAARWLKQKTLIPAPDRAPAPTLITRYRYTDLPSASADRARFLVLAQESVSHQGQAEPLMTITRQYVDDPASPFLGRLKCRTETIQGVDTVFEQRYELVDDTLATYTVLSAQDRNRSATSVWHNVLTGKEVKTVEQLGVGIETAYDQLGRKTHEVIASQTSSQAARRYSYRLAEIIDDPVEIRTIAANGAGTLTRLDGMGRESTIEVQDVDTVGQPMRVVYSATYDELGQLAKETNTDWLDGKAYPVSTRHTYDDWGNRSASIGPDNVLSVEQYDPIALTRTEGFEKGGKTVITQNLFGKNDSVERFDSTGKSLGSTKYLYDGLGRCVQQTDPYGRNTRFEYDFADRLVQTQLPDGTRIRKAFVEHSTEDLATHIWVNDYLAGQRTYDGLLRVTRITVGGRTETFSYDDAQAKPATHTTASGKVISYQYDRSLNNQMTERRVEGNSVLTATLRYDSSHAKLIEASCTGNQQVRSYSPSGQLKSDQLAEGTNKHDSAQRNSLNGLPLYDVDACGLTKTSRYDTLCRLSEVVQGSVKASYSYDAFGRVNTIETLDTLGKRKLTTQLKYDDFGREVSRVLTVDAEQPEELSQQFDKGDKLVQRTLRRGQTVLRDESFAYDARGRLEDYRCSGEHLPVDSANKAILGQTFLFDELDNVRQLKTVFAGGENTATYDYQNPDKTQLTRVCHSHPDYASQQATFTYDLDGNQLNDERGRRMNYDDLGRLASVAQE